MIWKLFTAYLILMQAAEWVGFIGASFCTLCLEVWRGRERERVESLLILKAKRDEV